MEIIRSFSLFDCFCFVSRVFCSFCIRVYEDSRAKNVGKTQFFFWLGVVQFTPMKPFMHHFQQEKKFHLFYIIGATILIYTVTKRTKKGRKQNKHNRTQLFASHHFKSNQTICRKWSSTF